MGDAKSLLGGTLLVTPLLGADGNDAGALSREGRHIGGDHYGRHIAGANLLGADIDAPAARACPAGIAW